MSLPLCLRRPVSALYAKSQTDICRVLLNQLITLIPGIDQCVDTGIDITQDPVNMLLAICREGSGLCLLFNAAKPDSPIGHSADSDMFPLQQFLKACESQLDLQPSDLFTIDDLEHGLPVQAINTLAYLLEISVKRRQDLSNTNKLDSAMRDRVVSELLETERRYVQDLEDLQHYMQEAQVQQVLGPDTLYNIFGNLSDLVDFQHRFLALIEEIADRPPYDQHFGKLFVELEISFAVYEPFCANIQTAQDTIAQETPRLLRLSSIMNPTFELPSNLIKPVQRLCRYPLLIQELIKATPKDWVSSLEQLREGLVAIQRVTTRVNETKRRQENAKIVHDLRRRVKGSTWKRSIGSFGLLLLQEKFTIERNKHDHHDVHIYLFEKSLLICERDPERRASTISVKKRNSRLIGGNGLLAVRGRIFISQIAQVDTDTSRPGKYKLQLFWSEKERKTPASFVITSCTIICRNKEQLCQWETTIQKLVRNEKILSDDMKPPLQQRQKSLIPRPAAAAPVPELVYGSSHLHIDEEWDRSSDDDDMNTIYRHYPQELLGQFEEQNCSAVGGQSNKICNGSGMHNAVVPRFPRDGSPPSLLSNSYPSTPSTIGTRSSAYLWNRKPSDASTLPTECSDSVSALSADDDRLLSLESSNLSQARSQSSPSIYRPLSDDDDDDEYSLSLLGQRAYTPYYVFSSPQPQEIKLRLHFEHELYLTMMPIDMTFNDLALRVDKKLTQLSTIPKPEWITLKYLDEDGDMITIETDEDVQMGLEGRREANAFNIYIIALSKKVN